MSDDMWGAPFSLRRLFWALLLGLVLVLTVRCSAQTMAELPQPVHHHHPAVAIRGAQR